MMEERNDFGYPVTGEKNLLKYKNDLITPEELYELLKEYVVGQDEALISVSKNLAKHYNTVYFGKGYRNSSLKPNMLIIGPSGVGKTYTIEIISELLDIPIFKVDISEYSEVGYVGKDISNIPIEFGIKYGIVKAKNTGIKNSTTMVIDYRIKDVIEKGIIFIDEIDKIAYKNTIERDVSGLGVQRQILGLIEGKNNQLISTKNMLFIFAGAFSDFTEYIMEKYLKEKTTIGFKKHEENNKKVIGNPLKYLNMDILHKELMNYGFIPELIGRLGEIVIYNPLGEREFIEILKNGNTSPINSFIEYMKLFDIEVEIDEGIYKEIARRAKEDSENLGARGLITEVRRILDKLEYILPSFPGRKLKITKEYLDMSIEELKNYLKKKQGITVL